MLRLGMVACLGLAACAAPGDGSALSTTGEGRIPVPPALEEGLATSSMDSFNGVWQSCQGASSPEECSRYVLVQEGERICGTWSYVASGKAYEGRLVARAKSSTEARRTRVCGRPGSETHTECSDGWQHIDKPLLLCDGGLGDLPDAEGACIADFEQAPSLRSRWEALKAEPWIRECLTATP